MRFIVRAESRGRIRVHADITRMSLDEADVLEYYLKSVSGVTNVKVYDRTCDAVINYSCSREDVTEALALFAFSDKARSLVPEHTSRVSDREFENRLVNRVLARYGRRLFLPHSLRVAWCVYKAVGFAAAGSYVYGGTVVEEGECVYIVDKEAGSGRYDRIVNMIEESERLKSVSESKAANLADRLVPYSFAGTLAAYALTRNVQTAMAFLMVDYSCALKLSMPLAVLSAMRESGRHKITVKGGKFLEIVSQADTIVFDKTGTLTNATPAVADVIAFGGNNSDEMLRIAACLEEHYPHSIANAVVEAARSRSIEHEEMHSEVEYVVAHGITSMIEGSKASIGSYHFIFEDEGCKVPDGEEDRFDSLPEEYSLLYLSISGTLAAVICIDDPVREGVQDVILKLREKGFEHIVMMTGDSRKTAAYVAAKTGVDDYIPEVLPEDKAEYIRNARQNGHKVIMIGDGINDSPALSEADAGIAVNTGAAIAREIADITVEAEDLSTLLILRDVADALMRRIDMDYRVILSFNTMLIALGASGIITPATSAMLHNLSTIGTSLYNMTDLI